MAELSFVDQLLQEPTGRFFVRVDSQFIQDHAMDDDVVSVVGDVDEPLRLLLDEARDSSDAVSDKAKLLYGLIHRKFLLTEDGVQQMIARFNAGDFPHCRRVFCHKHTCLPMGLTETFGVDTMKMFCPNCSDVYTYTQTAPIDGAFFGSEWIHRLMHDHREIIPSSAPEVYEPRVYGFKVFLQQKK